MTNIDALFNYLKTITLTRVRKSAGLPADAVGPLMELCRIFVESDGTVRQYISKQLDSQHSYLYFLLAERFAVDSVRVNSLPLLQSGLIALVIEDCKFDWRETTIRIALLYRSAQLIGIDANDQIAWAAQHATEKTAQTLVAFANRPPELKSLGEFFLSEGVSPEGVFAYLPVANRQTH